MTDINNWYELIKMDYTEHRYSITHYNVTYVMLPFNEYQMGNLLGLLKRSKDKANGDWYWEVVDIIFATMKKLEIKELISNFGDTFTVDNLQKEME